MAAVWTFDLQTLTGGAVSSAEEFSTAQITRVLDGPGSVAVDLPDDATAALWLPGQRRIVAKADGTPKFSGYLTRLEESSRPTNDISLRASGLGLASVLDYRIVHGDFNKVSVVGTTIAWDLITHAQGQTDGNHGFTLGTVTGTAPSRTRYYCDGDVISEAIAELAEFETGGFDWEISPTGQFNAWVGGRGTNRTATVTLDRSDTIDWQVQYETSDLATYVTALGQAEEPCGAPLQIRSLALASTYGRREVVVESETNTAAEMEEMADEELRARAAARINVRAAFYVDDWPTNFELVDLGDTITVTNPTRFGGTQTMRCTGIVISLEQGMTEWREYTFEGIG